MFPHVNKAVWLGVVILVLVLGLGGTAPLLNKWRKGQSLGEPTAAQSLSLTPTADPVPDDMSGPRKVA